MEVGAPGREVDWPAVWRLRWLQDLAPKPVPEKLHLGSSNPSWAYSLPASRSLPFAFKPNGSRADYDLCSVPSLSSGIYASPRQRPLGAIAKWTARCFSTNSD